MGKNAFGSSSHTGNAPLMDQSQLGALQEMLKGLGPEANQALMSMIGGGDPAAMQNLFQQSFIDPAMMNFEQQVIPGIQASFGAANAGSSSALNQALAKSGQDLSTMLGSQMGQFAQGQQANSLNALGIMGQGIGQRAFDPIITQNQGWMSPLIGGAGQAAGALGGAYLGGGRK